MNLFSTFINEDNKDNKENIKKNNHIVSVVNKINDHFNIPITYNKDKVELKENIAIDLELVKTIDPSGVPIYSFYFNNENEFSEKVTEQIVKFYTTDTTFLKDSQTLLKKYKPFQNKDTTNFFDYKNILNIWNEIKLDEGFREKYYYVDWEILEFLNRSELFLQFISIYNLFSPIFSLMMPIFILIIPFFIIRMRGLSITVNEYFDVLKFVAQTNSIGKLFTTNFNEIGIQEKIYILISAAFYLFSIYQNIMVCVRFNNNMQKIHEYFNNIESYLDYTLQNMENYLLYSNNLESYNEFNENVIQKRIILKNIKDKLSSISEYSIYNFGKFKEIGNIFKYFYELHTESNYNEAILYSFGFNGYIDCFEGLQKNIKERKISFAKFTKNKNKKDKNKKDKNNNIFKNNYYACLSKEGSKPIKNTIKLNKNIIITGPNASGKTTILKSTLINIILTQQFGCGFYDSAQLSPFNHIHCYLNIPDTSGRDSLFQAEARRCKDILNCITENPDESHFCVFDELYSGTNPEEAEISAISFMIYLQKYKLVTSLLTTHFIKVCKNLENTKTIQNYKMVTQFNENKKLFYTYKMKKGISEVKGGINVLTDLNYPKEIIDRTISETN